jgi:hypothetical protein
VAIQFDKHVQDSRFVALCSLDVLDANLQPSWGQKRGSFIVPAQPRATPRNRSHSKADSRQRKGTEWTYVDYSCAHDALTSKAFIGLDTLVIALVFLL